MKTIGRFIVRILFVLTLVFYFFPLLANLDPFIQAIGNFSLSTQWLTELYNALDAMLESGQSYVMLMIFELLCLMALKKQPKVKAK